MPRAVCPVLLPMVFALLAAPAFSALARPAAAMDTAGFSAEELEAFQELRRAVRSMETPSARRPPLVRQLADACRGQHAAIARRLVAEAYADGSARAALGALSVLARVGDDAAFAAAADGLVFITDAPVRSRSLRCLPAFAFPEDEAVRLAWLAVAESERAVVDPALRDTLRGAPPPGAAARFDASADRRRRAVARLLAEHAEPLSLALARLDDPRAVRVVRHYVADALGRDRSRWPALWTEGRHGYLPEAASALREQRRVIVRTLADFGAEGSPEMLRAFKLALENAEAVDEEIVLNALADLAAHADAEQRRRADASDAAGTVGADMAGMSTEEVQARDRAERHAEALFAFARGEALSRLRADRPSAVRAAAVAALSCACPAPLAGGVGGGGGVVVKPRGAGVGDGGRGDGGGDAWGDGGDERGAGRRAARRSMLAALRRFALGEGEAVVRQALVVALADLNDPEATALLALLLEQWPFQGGVDGGRAEGHRAAAWILTRLAGLARSPDPEVSVLARAALADALGRDDLPAGAPSNATLGALAHYALQRATGDASSTREAAYWMARLDEGR